MLNKISFAVFILLLLHLPSTAQEQVQNAEPKIDTKHSIGIAAGRTTGIGLSYRYWPGDFGVQATFGPVKNEYATQISSGVTFLYRLVDANPVNLFLYQGNHFHYAEYQRMYYPYPPGGYEEPTRIERQINVGVGIGIEVIILKRISFNLMGGYGGFANFEEIGITGEVGLFYNF